MQALIDHAAAVIIGGAILFMVAAMSLRANESSIEAAQVDMGKGELRALVDLLEQDFTNAGSGMTHPNKSYENRVIWAFGPESGYTVLRFYGLQDDSAAPDTVLVTYRWRKEGTATLPSGAVLDTYSVERSEAGGDASLHQNVTGFSIALTDKEYGSLPQGALNLQDARYIDVAVSVVSPVGPEGLLQQTQWSKQFRPLNLNPEGRYVVQATCLPVSSCVI